MVAIFYRGAAIGTYWHASDARLAGFTPQQPTQQPSLDRLMNHIVYGTVASPYVSLTRSYGIALNYALDFSRTPASATNPAFVYEIEIADPLPPGLSLLDPLREVVQSFPQPESDYTYHHNVDHHYLLGVISPTNMRRYLRQMVKQPPPGGGTPSSPLLTLQLQTIVRALRDAEVLAFGNIPRSAIRATYSVW